MNKNYDNKIVDPSENYPKVAIPEHDPYAQPPPSYSQPTPSYVQQPAPYGQPPPYGQQPPPYGQQPPPYGQQPPPYGQQPPPYGQQPPPYGQQPPPYGNAPPAPPYSQPAPFSTGPHQQTPGMSYPPPPSNYMSNPAQPGQFVLPQQIMPVNPVIVTTGVVMNVVLNDTEYDLFYKSRRARIALLVNFFFDFLLLIGSGLFILVVLFNIVGILATNRYNKCLGITYEVYMPLLLILKLAIMFALFIPAVFILFGITIVPSIISFILFTIFLRKMLKVSDHHLIQLRNYRMMHRRSYFGRCCFFWW